MGKSMIPTAKKRVKGQPRFVKDMSHSTHTAKRHPNSKRVKQNV
jgi:hypothetical protein